MPDVYYDSTLTGKELDEALCAIPDNLKRSETAAKAAESWAQGGTDTRPGEDEDNAEYWAKQAKTDAGTASAGAQVVTDNKDALQAVLDNLDAVKNAAKNAELAEAAAESAATDAERAEEAADRAQSISQGALGYYATADGLKAAHKTGENGQWAIIGETDTIWVWDSDSGAWSNSGNKTDLSQYYTKEEADAALEQATQELNESLETTTQALNKTVEDTKAEALGKVLYLYSAVLTVGGWNGGDDAGYTQEASVTAQDGGQDVTAATQLGIPMARPTGVQEDDEAMNEALSIINMGTSTPGEGTVTVKVWEKPETDITVFWYGR